MKIAVFGAGAIGGYLAVKLHQTGAAVSVIARRPHLAAMRERGLTLKSEGETTTVRLPCTDSEEAGPQDYVIVTLKANGLSPAALQIAKLMGISTAWTDRGGTAGSKALIPAASYGICCRRARPSAASSIRPPK